MSESKAEVVVNGTKIEGLAAKIIIYLVMAIPALMMGGLILLGILIGKALK